MEKCKPIVTKIGILSGRDCIFLDRMESKNGSLVFYGEVNGALASENKIGEERIPYRLTFENVLYFSACELDTYLDMLPISSKNSFEVIEDSKLLRKLSMRQKINKNCFTHYRLYTYDDVFDIIAENEFFEIR